MRPLTIDLLRSATEAQKIHVGVNADLFHVGDYALKVFRRDSPRAGNEFRTYTFIDGENRTPRAFDFIKPENQHESKKPVAEQAPENMSAVAEQASENMSAVAEQASENMSAVAEQATENKFGAAFCLEWVNRCEQRNERQLGVAVANFHSMHCPPESGIKYTSDSLPLVDRLQTVARGLAPSNSTSDYVIGWIVEHSDSIGETRGLVHRDLIEANIIWAIDGPTVIDWEWAALAPPAWDFVKLRRWLKEEKQLDFEEGYRSVAVLPSDAEIRFFEVFDQFTDACRVDDLQAITDLRDKL